MKYRINQISGVKFGTSGARGLVSDMTDQVCYMFVTAFLVHVKQNTKTNFSAVALAGDLRASTPRILKAAQKAVEDFGCVAADCGKVPTPALALYGITNNIPSIMITGSHISDDRNGIKFFLPEGEILKKDEIGINEITVEVPELMFNSNGMFSSEPVLNSAKQVNDETQNLYINRLVNALPPKALHGMRIGFYEHSAVGRDLLCDLYTELGAKVTRLGRSDTFIPVDTEAVRPEDFKLARDWAYPPNGTSIPTDPVNPRFDAILSSDGDGDRPLVFDEHGQWIRGDIIGIICARFLNADFVATPVSSTSAIERCKWFANTVRTKIGSPFVVEVMENAKKQGKERVVGFEANGGFFTATPIMIDEIAKSPLSPLPTRDAAIAHIAILCMAKKLDIPLSALSEQLPRRITLSDRIKDYPSFYSHQKLEELILGGHDTIELTFNSFGELTNYDTTDGLRLFFGENDIVHLRPSGNAPEFRCYTESDTRQRAEHLLRNALELVQSWRKSK